ncbi:hypothetical protein, partial [Magnetospirillum moscoviense]|uniref:hypothetical protein n=1 Tax=Magnetospirillum moscoviense TaxID=1437059 RepID=UPI0009EDC642
MLVRLPALIATMIFLSSPVLAQTAPSVATPQAGAVTDTVAVPIWPTAAVTLPEMQPAPASFSLGAIEGVAPDLLSGVTAKGYARKVPVDNQVIGQVQVLTVSKGDREETISTEGLVAQFDAKDSSQLFPEKTLQVQGSKTALIAALQRLSSPKTDKAEKPAPRDDVSQNQTAPGGGSKNDQASAYQTPTITATPVTQEKEPVVDMRTTSEGCPIRVDVAQGRAFQQSKEQTFTDGALTADGQCSDSEVSFVLRKSYPACPIDILDLATLKAWPQFVWAYTDDAGETHQVGECAKDEETPYTITEDEAQCSMFLDFSTNQAVPQAALVYINRNNALQQARGCDTSTKSASVAMTENVPNCPMRHDFGAGLSSELSMWTYVRGGITYQAAPCADTGRTFAHEIVYTDLAGGYVCTPVTNMTTKTVTLQSRKRITVDGTPQFITECTPDTSTQAILPTPDGCNNPATWTHDLDAGISYGQERFYYLKADGSREYVTGCQNSAVTYAHEVTETGYQHHDDQLWSYPLTTVTITVSGSPYTVASSQVLAGAPQVPYVLSSTGDQSNGQILYEACNAYTQTTKYQNWQRPDGSAYAKAIGTGTPTGPSWACAYSGGVATTDWALVSNPVGYANLGGE